jgi:hypothetical protein
VQSSRWKRVAPRLVLCIALLVVGVGMAKVFKDAHHAAQTSAQLALFKEAEELLEVYRAKHGQYPTSLDSLSFTFPDGGDDLTLAKLQYKSDGRTYSLVTIDPNSGHEYRTSR